MVLEGLQQQLQRVDAERGPLAARLAGLRARHAADPAATHLSILQAGTATADR